jgi:hypothetical protein
MTRTRRTDVAALGGPLAGLTFVAGVAGGLATAAAPYPRPGSTVHQVQAYFQGDARAARISVAGQVASCAALFAFTVSAGRLADRAGARSPGLRTAALAGGALASAALATSAVTSARLTGPAGAGPATALRLHRRAFVTGGPVHGAGFGLLLAALALAGRRTGELPAPLTTAATASAAAGLLSPLCLVAGPAVWFVPAGRFSGLVVSAWSGVRLFRDSRRPPAPGRAGWRGPWRGTARTR